jgi:hypothetical protein
MALTFASFPADWVKTVLSDLEEALEASANRGRKLEDFQAAAEVLLTRQFAYRTDRGSSRLVATVMANRAYFGDLMLAVGRRLIIDERAGMVGAVPVDGRGRRLPLEDSLLLLTMRVAYQDGIPGRINDEGEVEVTTDELIAKLEELSGRRKDSLPRLRGTTGLSEVIGSLGQGVVREGEAVEGEDRNRVLHLRAGLLHAVGADALTRLEAFTSEIVSRRRAQPGESVAADGDVAEIRPSEEENSA